MMLKDLINRSDVVECVTNSLRSSPTQQLGADVLDSGLIADARAEIISWPGYAQTPLLALDTLAHSLNLGRISYKDEGPRFGLKSFKALGGAYAVLRTVEAQMRARGVAVDMSELRSGRLTARCKDIVISAATDGNHGRAVAWGAGMIGAPCKIYLHTHVSAGREAALRELGAEIIRTDGDYDDSVRHCAADSAKNGWHVVSDTSYAGYDEIPRWVMAGYGVMAAEIAEQLEDSVPTHCLVPAGVGGLAAALSASFRHIWGDDAPRLILIESNLADCYVESFRAAAPTAVAVHEETAMAGLSCGEVSSLAWQELSAHAFAALSVTDDGLASAMRAMADGQLGGTGSVEAGECAVAGIVALAGLQKSGEWREMLGVDAHSHVLLIGTEGATDRDIYHRMIAS